MNKSNKLYKSIYKMEKIPILFVILNVYMSFQFKSKSNIIIFLFNILVILSLVFITKQFKENKSKKIDLIYIPLIIFLISVIIKLFVLILFGQNTVQVSDFQSAIETSKMSFPLDNIHYRIFYAWGAFVPYLKFIGHFFGNNNFVFLFLNCIISSLSISITYYIGYLIFSKWSGLLAAGLFLLSPTMLIHEIIVTPDFLNIFFLLLFLLFLILFIKVNLRKKWNYLILSFSAIFLAFSGFFKSIDKLVIITLTIFVIFSFFKYLNIQQSKKRYVKKTIFIVLCFFSVYSLSRIGLFNFLDYYYNGTVVRNPMGHYIYEGLSPKGRGTWDENLSKVYPDLIIKNNFNYEESNREIINILVEEINTYGIKEGFFKNKFYISWILEGETLHFHFRTMGNEEIVNVNYAQNFLNNYSQFYYFIILCISSFTLIINFIKKHHVFITYLTTFIFGFVLFSLIIEVQARYKIIIYPYLYLISGYGINLINKNIIIKFLEKKKIIVKGYRHEV